MRYLLDSCTWIFLLTGSSKLKVQQKQIILDSDNTLYLDDAGIDTYIVIARQPELEPFNLTQ